jgi:hypothetical protein
MKGRDIVIVDDLACHKFPDATEAIEALGAMAIHIAGSQSDRRPSPTQGAPAKGR